MAKVRLEIDTEPAWIDALRVYLDRKDTCLELEIERHVESLYSKNVPAAVRDFISSNIENKSKERRSEVL